MNIKTKKKIYKGTPYQIRDQILKKMGFDSYYAYLDSKLWNKIRKQVLSKFPKCLCCGYKASQIHHIEYSAKTLHGDCLHGLVSICRECHDKIETEGYRKRTLKEANKLAFNLIEKHPEGVRWLEWRANELPEKQEHTKEEHTKQEHIKEEHSRQKKRNLPKKKHKKNKNKPKHNAQALKTKWKESKRIGNPSWDQSKIEEVKAKVYKNHSQVNPYIRQLLLVEEISKSQN